MTEVVVPCPWGPEEEKRWLQQFMCNLLVLLANRLAPLGIREIREEGDTTRNWRFTVRIGDGTPIETTITVGELIALNPDGTVGSGEEFAQLCCEHIAQQIVASIERSREPPPEQDLVKLGKIPVDGFVYLELGGPVLQKLGDKAYEMAAEFSGDKEPDNPTTVTSYPSVNVAKIAGQQ